MVCLRLMHRNVVPGPSALLMRGLHVGSDPLAGKTLAAMARHNVTTQPLATSQQSALVVGQSGF